VLQTLRASKNLDNMNKRTHWNLENELELEQDVEIKKENIVTLKAYISKFTTTKVIKVKKKK